MPTTETTPADGIQTVAAAQVLNRRVFVVKAADQYPNFASTSIDGGQQLRDYLATPVQNLPSIYIHLFLLPTYTRGIGGLEFRARNNIEWRPVFRMPPDTFPDDAGTAVLDWIPMASPMILPVAVPVAFKCCCAGIDQVSVEVRIGAGDPDDDQGEDQIVFSISASS